MIKKNESDTSSPRKERAVAARERSHVYRFLAVVFGEMPSAGLLHALASGSLREALVEAGVDLGPDLFDEPRDLVVDDLAVEYTCLFEGPGNHIPPYESVHVPGGDGQLWGPATVAVKRYIEAAGFEYDRDFHGLPDHIGVELQFLAALCEKEALAWEAGDEPQALNCREYEDEFMNRHLGTWAPGFFDKVIEGAELPFYRQMAELAAAFITSEVDELAKTRLPSTAVAERHSGAGQSAAKSG